MIRGATYELEITISNSDTGTPVNLTGVIGILVGLYGEGKRLFAKYSYIDKTAEGYGIVNVVQPPTLGKITVAIEASETLQALEKKAKAEVVLVMPNNLFEGNMQVSIDTEIEIERVERSIFEGVDAI